MGYCWILFEWFSRFLEPIQWSFSWTSPEMKAPVEVANRNLGFFVCGFCWLMRFWLNYEVLGVWVDGLLLDFVWMISGFLEPIQWSFSWTLPEMKAPAEVADRNLGFFCFWVLLIDAFLVDLWSFGCLSWWVIVGFCLNDFWVSWIYSMTFFMNLAGNESFGGSCR